MKKNCQLLVFIKIFVIISSLFENCKLGMGNII